MQLSSQKRRPRIDSLPMTSMIDVVFLLLIFFMVTTSWSKAERELDSGIQVQKAANRQAVRDLEPARVDVEIVDGRVVYRLGGRGFESLDELTGVLVAFPNKGEGAVVRVSGAVPFEYAASAIQACKSAGFSRVSYVPGGTR